MKILHIGKFYYPFGGGIENFMHDLLPELEGLGTEVRCLAHHHQPFKRSSTEVIDGVQIVRVPMLGRLVFAPVSPSFPLHLAKLCQSFRPDILHLHMPNVSAFSALLLPSCEDIPWVVHWHSDVVASEHHRALASAYRLYQPLERKLLERASRILATSREYLESSPPLQKVKTKTEVVPIGVRATSRHAVSTPAKPGSFKLLCIGRLSYYKGHEYLVRAVMDIPDCQLDIAGAGDRHTSLSKLVVESGAEGRIRLLGFVDGQKLSELLATCDALCLPSIERTEAFGVVLIEAMRAGKPVIATRVEGAGMISVVSDGVTGLLVEPGNVAELAAAIRKLKDNRSLRQAMGRAGQARFLENFTIDHVARRINEIYRTLV